MDYNVLFRKISDKVIVEINNQYSMKRLGNELKMEVTFNEDLLSQIIYTNCKEMLNDLTNEQIKTFAKFCEHNKENCKNTMLATKYDNGNLSAVSFVEYEICSKIPEFLKLNKKESRHSQMFFKYKHLNENDDLFLK